MLPASQSGGFVPTGAQDPEMQTCWSPQSMALVQLGGAQTWCVLQLAPAAQALLLLQGLPTATHWPLMQLLPASQSAEREHCGIFAHAPLMQVAPALHSEFCVQTSPVVPEQLHAGSAAKAMQEKATRSSPTSRRRTAQRFPQFWRSQYPANACEVEWHLSLPLSRPGEQLGVGWVDGGAVCLLGAWGVRRAQLGARPE